jgi:hypothetical protein
MGLDMYLNAERYLWSHTDGDRELGENIAQLTGLPEGSRVKTIKVEAGYWRKANHIHKWFVDNVQEGTDDCRDAFVSRDELKELREVCKKVLDDHELAPTLLPTSEGFFFGGNSYDQWYFNDIEDTIKIIDDALALPESWDFEYHSSW